VILIESVQRFDDKEPRDDRRTQYRCHWLEEQVAQASPDLLRSMVQAFAEALMGAEADAVCGAGYGERSDQRANTRNGHREHAAGVGDIFAQAVKTPVSKSVSKAGWPE
jgi:hypothetical protein